MEKAVKNKLGPNERAWNSWWTEKPTTTLIKYGKLIESISYDPIHRPEDEEAVLEILLESRYSSWPNIASDGIFSKPSWILCPNLYKFKNG